MALTLHVIPTGASIQTAAGQPAASLQSLHSWIAKETSVKEGDQILLTSKGKHVQAQTLLTEDEFFLYDRELFASSSSKRKIPSDPLPEPWSPGDFPTDLKDPVSLKAWQSLFSQRRQWAAGVLATCRSTHTKTEKYQRKRKVIEDGLRVATSKHESFFQKLAAQQAEAKVWLDETLKTAGSDIQAWEEEMGRLDTIPVDPAFQRFFGKPTASRRKSFGQNTSGRVALGSFLDSSATTKVATEARAALKACEDQLKELEQSLEKLSSEYEFLIKDLSNSQSRSLKDDPQELLRAMKEIEAIVARIISDHERVMTMDSNQVREASKIALLHTRNFLPSLKECATEMDALLRHAVEEKNSLTDRALDHLQTIARIETAIPGLRKAFENLELSDDGYAALEKFSSVGNLPMVYGSLLLEAIKRKEWIDKMKHDSAMLAEEIAGYQEEEQKRRRKWIRGVANTITDTVADGHVLSVEINLQGEDQSWPNVTREDFEAYLSTLQAIPGMEPTVESLTQTLRNMDQPTRQQVKRAKAFKMGSVHEAAFGRGSLLLRGDDEIKVLREANLKLEEEVKGHKSRTRKLEDLLHRQSLNRSVNNRLSVGNGSQSSPFGDQPMTPVEVTSPQTASSFRPQDNLSRRSSTSSRRVSFNNHGQDEKALARRIVQLEADLMAAKDIRSRTEKTHQAALHEANSTKRDLLENMDAQQREFSTERKSLEEELERMKLKLEEMEDDFDRLVGSRENEKTGVDARVQVLISERDEARRDSSDRIKLAERRSKSLERNLQNRADKDVERLDLLKGLHNVLEPNVAAPDDPSALITSLEALVLRSQDQAREVAQAVALARSENGNLQAVLDIQKTETTRLRSELETKEGEIIKAQEEIRTEMSKAASIAAELDSEREHLKELREKWAEGETGSESLRKRLEEEQEKVSLTSTKLAETKSHVNSLDVELSSLQSKYRHLHDRHEASGKRLAERSQRAKTVSQRLYASNDRLNRILQALGFVVTFEDDKMKVERASKVGGVSVSLSDATASVVQQRGGLSSSPMRWVEDLSDVSLLLWMEKDLPADEEANFNEYMERISRFNLDIFSEAITKRMRDMEHTARKWQREARNYRDKGHKYQAEAHDKIAYRNFKDGDLALFLPTRNQAMKPWAAFNVGAPHYFLREQDSHKLVNRDWLVARISKVEERIVDLSKGMASTGADDGQSFTEASDAGGAYEDDNPFDLSDGLRWYLLDAQEEKPGAPSTPGLGKAIVSTSNVSATRDEAKTSAIRIKKKPTDAVEEASKALSRSLDSRRSSHSSKKGVPGPAGLGITKSSSSDALSPDLVANDASSAHKYRPGPSHLRTTSDAASLRADDDAGVNATLQEEQNDSTKFSARSPTKSNLTRSLQKLNEPPVADGSFTSPSPTKPKPAKSHRKSGVWDSLFALELNLQGGKRK